MSLVVYLVSLCSDGTNVHICTFIIHSWKIHDISSCSSDSVENDVAFFTPRNTNRVDTHIGMKKNSTQMEWTR